MSESANMKNKSNSGQTQIATEKNTKFFLRKYESYRKKVQSIDTYVSIFITLGMKLQGMRRLLDMGNGGVFDYDTTSIEEIVGLDLFLDNLPDNIHFPENVRMVQGNALDIPKTLHGFDGVVMVMLIHHLVGKTVKDCVANIQQLLSEAHRVLHLGGKLFIIESCVPNWFYVFEKMVFLPATLFIEKVIKHPPTIQYPSDFLMEMIEKAGFSELRREYIPKGKHVIQYGVKVPSWITPVQPVLFSAVRP